MRFSICPTGNERIHPVSLIWKVKWGNNLNMSRPVNGVDQFPPDDRAMMYE